MALPLLAILSAAPAMLQAGMDIFAAVTGKPAPPAARSDPQVLAATIEQLPTAQREQIYMQLLEAQVATQQLDTQRFIAMTQGDVEQIRATARPQMALAAMNVVTLFSQGFRLLIWATVLQWMVLMLWTIVVTLRPEADAVPKDLPSVWAMLAQAQPVAEMIWGPLIASFAASVSIVKKYMGVRERDKAQEYEIQAGRPLNSAQATIQAASGAIASIARVIRGNQL